MDLLEKLDKRPLTKADVAESMIDDLMECIYTFQVLARAQDRGAEADIANEWRTRLIRIRFAVQQLGAPPSPAAAPGRGEGDARGE